MRKGVPEMQDYVFITDDNCDLPLNYYADNGIDVMHMTFSIDGVVHTNVDMPPREFYDLMRAGKLPITAQVTIAEWTDFFEPFLQAGRDVLYIAFSSGLSGTFNSATVAARDLGEKYPGRKCIVVDSLCASLGQGLLVHKANNLRKAGASIDEVAKWVEYNRLCLSHLVAADDLMHLFRGGRVSRTSAVAGSLLGIKPIIHMNNEGKLIAIDKIRGRKQSLQKLVDMSADRVGDTENDIFMICHSDCEEEANWVGDLIEKRFGIKERIIHFIGPVIGTHTGPGTIAVFLMAKHR